MLFFLYLPCVYTADIIPSAKIAFPLLERQFQDSTDVRTQRYSTILNLKEGRKDRKEEGWVTEWGRYGVSKSIVLYNHGEYQEYSQKSYHDQG